VVISIYPVSVVSGELIVVCQLTLRKTSYPVNTISNVEGNIFKDNNHTNAASVSKHSESSVLKQGLLILQKQGFIAAAQAGLRLANLNYQGYLIYAKYLYRKYLCSSCHTTDPFTVFEVSPEKINRSASASVDRWDDLGAVRGGDWDETAKSIWEHDKIRSIVDHFENDTPWEETDVYQEAVRQIEQGNSYWNGCLSMEEVEQRISHIEELYETIKDEGYSTQAERRGKSLRNVVLNRKFDRSQGEVAVAIGRDGEILFVDGNHRLAISKILQLDSIPVHVIQRHTQWEHIRESITKEAKKEEAHTTVKEYKNHPDIEHLLAS